MKKYFYIVFMVIIIAVIITTLTITGCTTASKKPIKVGAPLPITGPLANDGLYGKQGIELGISDVNANGGVLGRQFEIDVFDIEYLEVEKVIAAADTLVSRDRVSFSVTGYAGLGPDIEAFGNYEPLFFHGDAFTEVTKLLIDNPGKYTNCFNMIEEGGAYSPVAFENDTKLPYEFPNKDIVLIAGDFGWNIGVIDGYRAKAKEMGWNVVVDEIVPYGTREWTPILTKIRGLSQEPAMIIISHEDFGDLKAFMEQFKQDPTKSIIDMGWIVALPPFGELLGADANGIMGWTGAMALPNEAGNKWSAKYKEKFGVDPGSLSGYVYDAVLMWANAAEKVGNADDHKAIKDYILNNPYQGISGTYDYRGSASNMPKIGADSLPMPYYQVQDGKLVMAASHNNFLPDWQFILPSWLQ
ncbi:MAG: ABC transporter substrate-binding protein [Actinobacteria bacterium]|nr:ABC transporter substrate-binding protein [Actinomycetota bacterium]MCL5070785.1 ABC transporter substrate-binding protein [Actinomycetota bacterium]